VVIGLGLCPFAAQPTRENRVHIQVCDCTTDFDLLETLHAALTMLDEQSAAEVETTLLVIPNMLADFDDYNQFLDQVDALLAEFGWEGKYQVASFHPQYRFADVAADAAENLTNRAPFPILHLIREDSLTEALANVAHPEEIPEQNIRRMNALSTEQKQKLFPWLFVAHIRPPTV
jgi:hypothetical protein